MVLKNNLIRQAEILKLDNIIFLPSVHKHEIIKYLSIIDVALVNLKKVILLNRLYLVKYLCAALQKPILLELKDQKK